MATKEFTKVFDGKTFHYYYNGKLFRNSKKEFKYGCIAISKEDGESWAISIGNNKVTTRNSMAFRYVHFCDLEVLEIVNK